MTRASEVRIKLALDRGITDRPSGVAEALRARRAMTRFIASSVELPTELGAAHMTLLSLLNRAQAFHDGAVQALRADNPFATFTLVRSYAENAAVLVWLVNKPSDLSRLFPNAPRSASFSVGKLTNFASRRMDGFKGIYAQLSEFAHPAALTSLAGWSPTANEHRVSWTSVPAFRAEDDFAMACVWLVELAEAHAHLWREVWEGYFGAELAPASVSLLREN